MLQIQIIQVGKTKDKYFKEAENEYIKRLSRYAKVSVATVKEEKGDKKKIIKKEGDEIIRKIPADSYVISLDPKGMQYNSERFAQLFNKKSVKGKITFIIGGHFGLSDEVKKESGTVISLSKMTFTHQMARIILHEQIYRGFTILEGKKYHY